jgi:hypothetical protein
MSGKEEPLNVAEDSLPELPRRLCSEIQLFDLCELERCRFKDGRFCTDPELLARFEAVAEPVDRPAQFFEDNEDEEELYPEDQEDDDDSRDFRDEDNAEDDDAW